MGSALESGGAGLELGWSWAELGWSWAELGWRWAGAGLELGSHLAREVVAATHTQRWGGGCSL